MIHKSRVLIVYAAKSSVQVDLGHILLENLETVVKLIARGISRGTIAPKFEYTGNNAIGEIIHCFRSWHITTSELAKVELHIH